MFHPRPPTSRLGPIALLALGLAGPCLHAGAAESPDWIWAEPRASGPATNWFQHTFRTPPYNWNARLTAVASGTAEVYLNGKPVAACTQPGQPVRAEVSMNLIQGENRLSVRARNLTGPAGLLVHLNLGGTETRQILSDTNWVVTGHEPANWPAPVPDRSSFRPAVVVGPYGSAPWGRVLERASATPAEALKTLPGFTAELLRSAEPEEGSWVCLAFDDRGRLYVSPEGDSRPLLRFSFDATRAISRVDPVPAPIRFAMGLLHAYGSLYANAKGPAGNGLYRLVDTNGNDRFDPEEVRFLQRFQGGGEHGYHALALGPDGLIYVLNGNVTKLPEGIAPHSPHRGYGEDVLSLNPDETTRATGALAPGCQVLRTDADGRAWELFAAGMRNAYDFDFNADGELFTWDSDNEWDWGTPWYRATRVFHVVSGAQMGWRDGTRAWPDHYPDMVGSVADIGIGSPCGVKFGTRARFPAKYRQALYLQDWSYGRILAVHLEPHGASYRGTFEEFVKGQPLNLTSMAFGPDGALYFITGGRGTQSGLYRVRYTGTLEADGAPATNSLATAAAETRARRRALEFFHNHPAPAPLETLWPALGDSDPAIRFAARVALEAQELTRWQSRALAETNPPIALTALLALARVGPAEAQPGLLAALGRFPLGDLDEAHRLAVYRICQLSFLRQGRPEPSRIEAMSAALSSRYPAARWTENRELCRLLLWLEATNAVPRTLDLLDQAASQEQQIHYVSQLRRVRGGWTPADRRRFFAWWLQPRDHLQRPGFLLHWFHDVGRDYVDGANLDRHLESFRRDAIAALPAEALAGVQDLVDRPIAGAQLIPAQPRAFVRDWKMADLLADLDRGSSGRDFERGRRAFIDTQCYTCHRLGNAGGAVGPELTGAASKYGRRELLESLLEPSKVISEQFQNVRLFLKDGDDVTGRLIRESATEIVVETDPLTRAEQAVARSQVEQVKPSPVSPMPEGLLQCLERDEILDLLAFLESAGKSNAPAFRRP